MDSRVVLGEFVLVDELDEGSESVSHWIRSLRCLLENDLGCRPLKQPGCQWMELSDDKCVDEGDCCGDGLPMDG